MDDDITRLEAELAGLSGTARAQTLLRLGQAQWMRYWRTGIGSRVGLPHLEHAIASLDEALGYLEPGDTLRVYAASLLGVSRCARNSAHNGPVTDRDAGIPLLEEALAAPPGSLTPAATGMARATLGEAYLRRSMELLQSPDRMMAAMSSGAPAATIADIELSIRHLRPVAEVQTAPQMADMAGKMLRVAESLHTILTAFGSPMLSSQLDVVMRSAAELQQIVRDVETNGLGLGSHITNASFTDTDWTGNADPMDYPSAMFREAERDTGAGSGADTSTSTSTSTGSGAHFAPNIDAMRADLRTLIAGDSDSDSDTAGDRDVFALAADLLQADEPPVWVDEFVAAAAGVVHSAASPSGADHFLLAVALHLRSRRDGDDDGWGEDAGTTTGDDAQAAVTSLLAAAQTVPEQDPDAIPALVRLAQLSPDGALNRLGARLGGFTALLQSVGADAVQLPEPAAALRWNAAESCFEPAAEPCRSRTLVIVDGGSLRESGPTALEDDESWNRKLIVDGGSRHESEPKPKPEPKPEPKPAVAEPDTVTVSYVASLSQLSTLSKREPRPVAAEPVFVANPRGDRMPAAVETMLLRRSFYPQSVGLGELIEDAAGAATAEQVRARLQASVLHLACGVTKTGALELAGSAELDLTGVEVEHGGLVILPPEHWQPLADILLTAGFTGVVGWRRPVSEDYAAVASFLLHAELADVGRAPAAAVRAVREQLRESDFSSLPPLLASRLETADIAGDEWTALVYRGR